MAQEKNDKPPTRIIPMPKKSQKTKPPEDVKYLRCGISRELGLVLDALLAAPPHGGASVQEVLLSALLHYIPHEQWQRSAAFVGVEPVELIRENIITQSVHQPLRAATRQ
jgi:hypothetical protein